MISVKPTGEVVEETADTASVPSAVEPALPPETGGNQAEELAYRLRQQQLLAEFGLYALGCADLDPLLHRATEACSDGLQTSLCKVLEYSETDDRLFVRAGVGWAAGIVGVAFVGADLASPAGYALRTGEAVISNHLTTESRFRTPKLLLEHGVRRAINVLIPTVEDDHPFGVLEVDSPVEGKFTRHDIAFLQSVANALAAAIGRLKARDELCRSYEALEARIADRTEELRLANERLVQEAAERRAAEAQRQAADALYRTHFQNTQESLFIIGVHPIDDDCEFEIERLNPAHERATGLSSAGVRGRRIDQVLPAKLAKQLASNYRRAVELRYPVLYEETLDLPAGVRHWETMLAPIEDAATGRIVRLIGAARDLTDRVKAEEQLRQSQKMEAIGQLTGGIAHDFNNLLTGIVGSLDIMRRRLAAGRGGDVDRYMDAAMTSANRAAALTHRLLAFARRQPLDPRPVDVNQLLTGLEDLVRQTVGPGVQVGMMLDADLWPVRCDANQLENALLNLAVNARDAMPGGGRMMLETSNQLLDEAYAATQRDVRPGDYAMVAVSDTGTGMDPATLKRVFDPFFTTKAIGQGTGLGLSMLHGFIKQSGGHVRIHSEVGRGTSVKFYLPRDRAGATIETPATAPAPPGRASDGETVLVVEDEPAVRMLILETLDELGYTALAAGDAAEAGRHLDNAERIDLLVTDVGLPGDMNGRQLADRARQLRPELRILFITGYAEAAAVEGGFLDRGMEIISKPFALDVLARRIREMIEADGVQPA